MPYYSRFIPKSQSLQRTGKVIGVCGIFSPNGTIIGFTLFYNGLSFCNIHKNGSPLADSRVGAYFMS